VTAGPGGSPGRRVVAVDGPSGSGKSTVARGVARTLGWRYVDTGATYRAATLAVLRGGTDLADSAAVAEQVRALVERRGLALSTDPSAPGVHLDGDDVTAEVRGPAVTAAVSAVSAVPQVRADMVALQRELMGTTGAVAEGRDVGAVVAPEAAVKVYLDADPAVRASRRAAEEDAGVAAEPSGRVAAVAADLARRDALDSTRAASPLTAAPDAVHLDASTASAEQVVARVLALVEDAGIARP
jgi:cytidylate kinase